MVQHKVNRKTTFKLGLGRGHPKKREIEWQSEHIDHTVKNSQMKRSFNILMPTSDKVLISPHNLNQMFKLRELKEMIINQRDYWWVFKFSLLEPRKCIKNSMENVSNDVRVEMRTLDKDVGNGKKLSKK